MDEIQKVPGWSGIVKGLWDADTAGGTQVKVVLLGSSPLLVQQGLNESLAGRFELIRVTHWSLDEMRDAFGFSPEKYIYFGGYPGSASIAGDEARWKLYIRDSLVDTSISRDILMMKRVDKPSLLKRLFEIGCIYSGQILSFNKIIGQLHDAGNTTTLSHYLELLGGAGLLTGLQKYSTGELSVRSSSPKFQVLNNALLSSQMNLDFEGARNSPDIWGRFVESAIGAHLVNASVGSGISVHYWRENNREVDFVLKKGDEAAAIEVKSGRVKPAPGMDHFASKFTYCRKFLVGAGGIPVNEFLSINPVELFR